MIAFAPGDTLTLDNVTPAQLQNSDFIFVPLTAGPATLSGGVEGATAATLSAIFSAADLNAPATDFSGTINWGDGNTTAFDSSAVSGGNGSFTVSGSHVYAEEGDYTATVTIDDTSGQHEAETATTTVADAPLTATGTIIDATKGSATGGTVQVASFIDADANAVAGPDGDDRLGRRHGGRVRDRDRPTAPAASSLDGTHTYAEEGSETISVSIVDVGGSTASANSSATVVSSGPTTDTWTSAATGDWVTDAADWSTGSPPNAGDVAEIASGTVQISSGLTLDNNAITIDSGAVIDITVTSGDIVTFDDGTTISGGGSGTLTVRLPKHARRRHGE